jgi:hypothetical protein
MNQLMMVERVENVEQFQRMVVPRRIGKTIANSPSYDIAIAALCHLPSSHSLELKRIPCEIRVGNLMDSWSGQFVLLKAVSTGNGSFIRRRKQNR